MEQAIKLLDCTLRDGGLGLEDIHKSDSDEMGFRASTRAKVAANITAANLDIVELGSIQKTSDDLTRFAIYQTIEDISAIMPKKAFPEQRFAALYRGPDVGLDEIPNWNESLCEIVRVIIRYSELQKSLDFCAGLVAKGYKVFVQPMLTMRYSESELDILIQMSNSMGAAALYFVDSYGYMERKDIERLFTRYNEGLNSSILIGFHAHNNMDSAYANALFFLDLSGERDVVIDSCILGMGQGAGNLQTELIVPYLNQRYGGKYGYANILEACEEIEGYTSCGKWGYSVTRLLPALYKTAYKYSLAYRNKYGFSFREIEQILRDMPDKYRQRYTDQNANEVLKTLNIKGQGML